MQFATAFLVFSSVFVPVQAQQTPDPHQVPVMDGEAGPCSITFTVTDVKGAPVYDARIPVPHCLRIHGGPTP